MEVPSELVVGGHLIESTDVLRWLRDLNAYKRSFEQVYWMAARYARSRGTTSAPHIIYREAVDRVKKVGFVDLDADEVSNG